MRNDADSLTETDVDETSDAHEGDESVEAGPSSSLDGGETADQDKAAPDDDPDATAQLDEIVTLEDLDDDAEQGAGALGGIVTLEDLEGDDAVAILDPDLGSDDAGRVGADDVGGAPAPADAGNMLFDGDPEEFELDFVGGPYPDARPAPGDVMVLDEPTGPGGPQPRRMSRMERRRRVRLQARRVRRIIRHIEPWSVLKISIFFYACLWVIFLVAGFMIWGVAESSGTVDKLENLIRELFALETFDFDAGQIFRGYALGGLALAIAGTTFNVLMCLLFNLISDLTGGLRITMIEEETVRPTPPRRRRRRPPSRA